MPRPFSPATAAAAVAVALSLHTHAAPPSHLSFTVDVTFPSARLTRLCGVPVFRHTTGTVRIVLFRDAVGTIVRELDTAPGFKTVTFSPAEAGGTGASFMSPGVAAARTTYPEGVFVGAPATIVFSGLQGRAPGAPEAGYDAFAAEVAFIDEAGVPFNDIIAPLDSHGNFTAVADFNAAVCAALAAP